MDLEKTVDKHADDIQSINKTINIVSTDVQLLVKDHKYLSSKMEEIDANIKFLIEESHKALTDRKNILYLSKELTNIQDKQREVTKIIDMLESNEKSRASFREFFSAQWWKICMLMITLGGMLWSALAFVYQLDPHT